MVGLDQSKHVGLMPMDRIIMSSSPMLLAFCASISASACGNPPTPSVQIDADGAILRVYGQIGDLSTLNGISTTCSDTSGSWQDPLYSDRIWVHFDHRAAPLRRESGCVAFRLGGPLPNPLHPSTLANGVLGTSDKCECFNYIMFSGFIFGPPNTSIRFSCGPGGFVVVDDPGRRAFSGSICDDSVCRPGAGIVSCD